MCLMSLCILLYKLFVGAEGDEGEVVAGVECAGEEVVEAVQKKKKS